MMRRTVRNTLAVTALAGAGLLAAAAPSFADTQPSASGQATVTVNQSIAIAFVSGQSFALTPGQLAHDAVSFNIQTNDSHGYALVLSASGDPQTASGSNFPSADLAFTTSVAGQGQVGTANQQLTNSPAPVLSTSIAPSPSGDTYTQDWLASIPSNQAPGSYSTTLTYTVTGR
jgi:hypothetical protein